MHFRRCTFLHHISVLFTPNLKPIFLNFFFSINSNFYQRFSFCLAGSFCRLFLRGSPIHLQPPACPQSTGCHVFPISSLQKLLYTRLRAQTHCGTVTLSVAWRAGAINDRICIFLLLRFLASSSSFMLLLLLLPPPPPPPPPKQHHHHTHPTLLPPYRPLSLTHARSPPATPPHMLSAAQVSQFHADGYTIVRGFASQDELVRAQSVFSRCTNCGLSRVNCHVD